MLKVMTSASDSQLVVMVNRFDKMNRPIRAI